METPVVAVLLTECGPLQIYSCQAVREMVAALPRSSKLACDVDLASFQDGAALCEGYSASAWAQYAKMKAAIASNMSHLNGVLKAKLIACRDDDTVLNSDPWASAAQSVRTVVNGASSKEAAEAKVVDPWSGWNRKLEQADAGSNRTSGPEDFSNDINRWVEFLKAIAALTMRTVEKGERLPRLIMSQKALPDLG